MKLSRHKNNITYLFLVLFLSMKMAGLHVLSHTDDKEHAAYCLICDHAIVHNLTPTLAPGFSDLEIKNIDFFIQQEIVINYRSVIFNNAIPRELFSRPPPFMV